MDEILFWDRYTQTERREKVYGDEALRWTYGTASGHLALHLLVKRSIFSRWYGRMMDRAASKKKIEPFIKQYDLDTTEFANDPQSYANFNEFFFRKLKPNARPIHDDPSSVVFPADGRHLCVPDISRASGLFVKGQMFTLAELLKDKALEERYAKGSLLLSRLCPVDYHRFHFPVAGTPGQTRMINGPLFSVNPIALRQNIQILATNKRCVTEVQTANFGKVLLLEIGATCVGSIVQTYAPNVAARRGGEKGYFKFGGSSTIVIFEPGRIQFDEDLVENSARQREVYARMGDHAASLLDDSTLRR